MNSRFKLCLLLALTCLFSDIQADSVRLGGLLISWTNRGQQTDFEIFSLLGNGVSPSSAWMGVGFNKSPSMNGASVVICTNSAGKSAVQHNFNSGYGSSVLDASNPQLGLSNAKVSVANGMLMCSFTRDNANANANYFNLNQNAQPYVIVGYGLVSSSGDIVYHAARDSSLGGVNFAAAPTTTTKVPTTTTTPATVTTTTPTTTIPTTAQITTPAPQTTPLAPTSTMSQWPEIGAFQMGDFNVNWRRSSSVANALDFTVSFATSAASNIYAAIAFSKDNAMGGDDVVACIYATGLKEVSRFYNPNGHMPPVKQANNNGISNQMISLSNGKLTCSFTRAIALNEANFFDLNTQHFLLVAAGATTDAGGLARHSTRVASSTALGFAPPASTTIPVATSTAQVITTTTNKPASSSILTTITQTVPTTTQRPNPVIYFSNLIKNFFTKLWQFFGAKN